MTDWIRDLLDQGIGALAVKYSYIINQGLVKSLQCPNCGELMRKFAHRCNRCRWDLPWIRADVK